MAQIEEDDLKNYNLKRFDCEDPFFMEIFALKVDDAGYMVFPGPTIVNSWIDLTTLHMEHHSRHYVPQTNTKDSPHCYFDCWVLPYPIE